MDNRFRQARELRILRLPTTHSETTPSRPARQRTARFNTLLGAARQALTDSPCAGSEGRSTDDDAEQRDDAPPFIADQDSQAAATATAAAAGSDAERDGLTALRARMIRQCSQAAEADLVVEHLAERIANFCSSPAVQGGGIWEVTIVLNPAILPETSLQLKLSPFRLSLRFDCGNARANDLICLNTDALQRRLRSRLGASLEIDIEAA
ncbi:type III secretion control protein HpaP [Collimonas sp. OK242]|uniref:type III secretion system protein SctP n=1 Tax=Collimonas sp. OK242 TaxID=1798195 RepID=UPI000895C3D7|nr:type III secretion system protein SctP [Collimonas sp. OK242]SDX05439.1 type III secretion control protein HpaP [Collimonas sp. OK242]